MAYLNERPVAQGEITFLPVTDDHFDRAELTPMAPRGAHYVVAHSESGNDHVLERGSVDVCTVKTDIPGMAILRVLVKEPTSAINLSPHGHKNLPLAPGLYEARISREMGLDDVIRQTAD